MRHHVLIMTNFWKTMFAFAVALPMLAYVYGALSSAHVPAKQYNTVVLQAAEATPTTAATPTVKPGKDSARKVTQEISLEPDDLSDDSDNAGRDDSASDNDPVTSTDSGTSGGHKGPKHDGKGEESDNGGGPSSAPSHQPDDQHDDSADDEDRDKSPDEKESESPDHPEG
jgi:hypothetical protein